MTEQLLASYYHADTADLARCQDIAATVSAVIYGARLKCFLSQNGRQVIFCCLHANALTRSAAIVLVKQFLHEHLNGVAEPDFGSLRVIVFANEKGGVAKTSSCVNLAACLAMRGKRVLLIDLDSQANATLNLGRDAVAPVAQPEKLLTDATAPLHASVVSTCVERLDLIPSGPSLQHANHILVSAVGRELRLRSKLVRFFDMPGTQPYDYVLIDSPPAADILTLNALMAATHLVVPVQASYHSLSAMSRLAATLDSLYDALRPSIQLLGILLTMYDEDRPAQRAMVEVLRERIQQEFGPFLFRTAAPFCPAVNESEAFQRPVVISHPSSAAATSYQEVADEILERLERNPIHGRTLVQESAVSVPF